MINPKFKLRRLSAISIFPILLLLLIATSNSFTSTLASQSSDPSPLRPREAPYLCRCTCFSTNTTVVPLYAPPAHSKNPCSACTRQFCLDQNLEACKDARIERPDADTGTGWEGDVWARCLKRDSYKDRTIIGLYLFTVIVLLLFAALRGRVGGWVEDVRTTGPNGVYQQVTAAPWQAWRNSMGGGSGR